jgi:NAD+ kinase
MKFAIISYSDNDSVKNTIDRILIWCTENSHEGVISESTLQKSGVNKEISATITQSDNQAVSQSDVILSVGGDGTLLRVARLALGNHKPILGINTGRLGFLANVAQDDIEEALHYTSTGNFTIDKRALLQATEPDGTVHYALNEFLFSKGGSASMISLCASFDDMFINRYWADGIIVASPTGSTAYNMSAGGPIIMPTTDVMVLNPINPHTLTTRPLILPSTKELTITSDTSKNDVIFSKDGEISDITGDDFIIKIRRSEFTIELIKLPEQTYFDTLRNKLMWGMDVRESTKKQ